MLAAIGSEFLHFEPTKEAEDFWKAEPWPGEYQCHVCNSGHCSAGLLQTTKQIVFAHLKLISSSAKESYDEILNTNLGKTVKSWFHGSENGEFDCSSFESAYIGTFESHISCIGQEQEHLVRECLVLFSGLIAVNDALVSLGEPSVEWPKKCILAQNVIAWHLSDGRQNQISTWIQMLLRKAAGILFFNVAKLKEVCSHQNFLLAFKWFEKMIERNENKQSESSCYKNKLMIRKPDKDIKASEFTITGILNMAACLLELRQTMRAKILLDMLSNKLFPAAKKTSDVRYLEAYADYIRGVCLFEDTNPQRLAIRKPSGDFLKKKYGEAIESLDASAKQLEECESKSSLLASVYTVRGIVRANILAEFNSDALSDLSKATNLECELKQPSFSMRNLLQILRIGSETASSQKDKDEWNTVYQQAVKCHAEVSLTVNHANYDGSSVSKNSGSDNANNEFEPAKEEDQDTNLEIAEKDETTDTLISQIEEPLGAAHNYLDCYRKQCLEYFKDRLKRCNESNSFLAAMLCHLFIAKYYIYASAKAKVECHQAKVSRHVLMHFGIHLSLESYKSISLKHLVSVNPEMGPALALICGFWIANQAELYLLSVVARNLKLFSPTLHTKDNKASKFITTTAFLKIFFSSNHFRLLDGTWRTCKALNEHAAQICAELSEEPNLRQSEFVAFLRIYVGELSYRMCDKIKDNQDFSASARRKSCDVLFSVLQQNLSSPEGNVRVSPLAVMCLTTLGNYSDTPRNGPVPFGIPEFRLHRFQLAYDLCAAAGLTDTEVHASLHLSVGMFLYSNACATVSKPAFNDFNAAIFKFRQAAQIFDTICGSHVGTAMAQGMISVLYFNQRQLEDQEDRALESFSECLRLEVSLLQNDYMPSPWLWKTIEVVRKCRYLFCGANSQKLFKWDALTKHLEMIRNDELQALLTEDGWKNCLEPKVPAFWDISDPLFDADEAYLVETSRHLRDMVYPRNSLPTKTEIRCYAQYLQMMWNHHKKECTPKQTHDPSRMIHFLKKPFVPFLARMSVQSSDSSYTCPLFKFWIHPRTHDFLSGLNDYTLQRAEKREATLLVLQENHRRMLCCTKIEAFLCKKTVC